jgi:hypothetical protein
MERTLPRALPCPARSGLSKKRWPFCPYGTLLRCTASLRLPAASPFTTLPLAHTSVSCLRLPLARSPLPCSAFREGFLSREEEDNAPSPSGASADVSKWRRAPATAFPEGFLSWWVLGGWAHSCLRGPLPQIPFGKQSACPTFRSPPNPAFGALQGGRQSRSGRACPGGRCARVVGYRRRQHRRRGGATPSHTPPGC